MAKSNDWLPHKDSKFDEWQLNFIAYAQAHATELGLKGEEVLFIKQQSDQWRTDYSAHTAATDTAHSATEKKDNTGDGYKKILRGFEAQIEANQNVSDETRKAAGLPARKKSRTPKPAPDTKPVLRVEMKGHRTNNIYCAALKGDTAGTSRGMPKGVSGCELYAKIGGTPPADETECKYLHLVTRSPYIAQFTGADAGKAVYYIARWLNDKGQPGPWSDVTTATIPA